MASLTSENLRSHDQIAEEPARTGAPPPVQALALRTKPLLSLVICTLDEASSIPGVLYDVTTILGPLPHEIIVVDDSAGDATAWAVRAAQAHHSNIRLIRRPGERGLASAAIEGWNAARGTFLAVMDGDGQHDPEILWRLLAEVQSGAIDVAVGSRYLRGASGLTGFRDTLSRAGVWLSERVTGVNVADPLSGLFVMRRGWFEAVRPRLSGLGFKILLDVLTSGERPARVAEVPTSLRPRTGGQSKLGLRVAVELAVLLARKRGAVRAAAAPATEGMKRTAP